MFALAILIGIYSYIIFSLGIIGQLYVRNILIATLSFIIFLVFYFKKDFLTYLKQVRLKEFKLDNISKFILALIFILAIINLIGALGPELSFDALWYHLTLPKIYLSEHKIFHIPGGLFYYSDMPKLGEMFYIRALALGNEITAKIIHFAFGVLTTYSLFKISRKFFDEKISIFASLVFYSSLVVSWQSTTAYVDLIRTFFETMGLWGFLEFHKSKNKKWLVESAIMVGLAVSTKLIALGTIPIFIALLLIFDKNRKKAIGNSLIFVAVTLLIPLPWFVFALINTGNPLYPIFSDLYPVGLSWSLLNPVNFVKDLIILFFRADDPISPVYVMLLPLAIILFKKFDKRLRIITLYSLLGLIVWYMTPRTGGGRFILPYLPAFSVMAAAVIAFAKPVWLKKYLIMLIVLVCIITIGYRGVANARYLPVILGKESRDEFLAKNLNFSFGDFYDTDGWFRRNISGSDRILLYGFHNLYYANFPFIHESFVRKGDKFNYIATQNADLPDRFKYWSLIHFNSITGVSVYSIKGEMWYY